jgi:DNA-binding NarL/FixJ family response regulator
VNLRILLVDDNKVFLTAVSKFLARLPGADVVAQAQNGPDALHMAAQLQPDLVLLDIAMPGMDGLEVVRAMQAWPRPPCRVLLSMHDGAGYRAAALEAGAMALVGKGDFVADLLPIIESLMASKIQQEAPC